MVFKACNNSSDNNGFKDDGANCHLEARPERHDCMAMSLVQSTTSFFETQRLQERKQEIFEAAREGRADLIASSLEGENPAFIKEVLHSQCDAPLKKGTPLMLAVKGKHMAVVRLLVEKFHVDINQKVEQETTALLLAVRHCRLDMVRFLVEHGADVSHADEANGSPLQVACKYKKMDIFKFLVNKGAMRKFSGARSGSFLIQCYQDDRMDFVKYLVENGANVNFATDTEKKTILHFAVEKEDPDTVKLLLPYGARLNKNSEGQSPLVMAALSMLTDIVEVFVASSRVLKADKIEGLELLGAKLLTASHMVLGYYYLYAAMKERFKHDTVIRKPCLPPLPAFGNIVESRTLDALESRKLDWHVLKMEGLIILQRCLGEGNIHIFDSYWTVLDSMEKSGRYADAISLNLHAMKIYRGYNLVFNLYRAMVLLFGKMPSVGATVLFSDVEKTLGLMKDELECILKEPETHCEETHNIIRELFRASLCLLKLATELAHDQDEKFRLRFLVRLFVDLPRDSPEGNTMLHFAALGCRALHPTFEELFDLPCVPLLIHLLECGADVSARNKVGDTPLHFMAKNTLEFASLERLRDATSVLMEAGAHLDAISNTGQTPMDLATEEVKVVFREYCPLNLKCLAARVIIERGVAYEHLVPRMVTNYIKLHSAEAL